ncbi:PepSY domain-containing protein [Variovorax sp. LT1P1]|uniref:PepSY domain-containing protein n=1 Tax=Variovorax sp. LT1P1 TaxID=3443730 RepID=UPI003F454DB7
MTHLLAIRRIALAMLVLAAQPVWAEDDCEAPPETWQPRSAVRALGDRNGWQIDKLKIDDGCYEIKGRDVEGRRFKAKLDPATLKVLRLRRDDHDHERARDRD